VDAGAEGFPYVETVRVDICYRPLRIAWAILSSDRASFREAIRLSHATWGGRFNPIVFVDRPDEATQIIELFRADLIVPLGVSEEVKDFSNRFPHLIDPFYNSPPFYKDHKQRGQAHVLDIHNALVHWHDSPGWKALDEQGIKRFVWDDDDPLADAFLAQYGAYPDPEQIGTDYAEILSQATLALNCRIDKARSIPLETLQHPGYSYLTRLGLKRHYSIRVGWDHPGFFVGNAANIDDLVRFWNLRAADIHLTFVDPAHIDRYALINPEYHKNMLANLAHLDDEHRRKVAVWTRPEILDEAIKLFEPGSMIGCRIGDQFFWKGGAVRAPTMTLGEASSLGVIGQNADKPKVSFALSDKPFSGDNFFHTQHLVASVTFLGANREHYSFKPPFVPEWNEFYARQMHFHYERLRIEPERVGIIIDAADHDTYLYGLPNAALAEKLFESAGVNAKLSGGGLIARQLISQLGGVDGARVFKIPGVRRLLKTFGPRDSFTKKAALELIGKKDPENPQARFSDHRRLFIEPRAHNTELTPQMVFDYLVAKGLFRIGAELSCPVCNLSSWIALDVLKQKNTCELCGNEFDATRQLVNGVFHYRRTGILGVEKNSQGAVPVTLVLQQLHINVDNFHHEKTYAVSYDLTPKDGTDLPPCEMDFLMIIPETYPDKAAVILGECKDVGGNIDNDDVENMRRLAKLIAAHRFDTYILFAKLAPFTKEEIDLVRTLNEPFRHRVILLTPRELEPFRIFERTKKELGGQFHGRSPDTLAEATSKIYFAPRKAVPEPIDNAQLKLRLNRSALLNQLRYRSAHGSRIADPD
jgi:hypothetical protein